MSSSWMMCAPCAEAWLSSDCEAGERQHRVCGAQAKMLVFLTSGKQVKFALEAFRRLRPGVVLRALHGKMKQMKRMAVYYDFCQVCCAAALCASCRCCAGKACAVPAANCSQRAAQSLYARWVSPPALSGGSSVSGGAQDSAEHGAGCLCLASIARSTAGWCLFFSVRYCC